MDFAEKLVFVRKKLNMSQEDLARELGVSFATVNRWELHKNTPNYRYVLAFEKFCLDTNIDFSDK